MSAVSHLQLKKRSADPMAVCNDVGSLVEQVKGIVNLALNSLHSEPEDTFPVISSLYAADTLLDVAYDRLCEAGIEPKREGAP